MLPFFLSVLVSALLLIAALYITRQRLTRQFEDIQRRLVETERTVSIIKQGIERSTTVAQLDRLHRGLVRTQENFARRFADLEQQLALRQVTDRERSFLQSWAGTFGLDLTPEQIDLTASVVGRAEMFEADAIPLPTADLLAGILALIGRANGPSVIGLQGSLSGLESLLPRVLPGFAGSIQTVTAGPAGSVDVLISDAATPSVEMVRAGGLLIAHAVPPESPTPESFDLVAGEWSTKVFVRKSEL